MLRPLQTYMQISDNYINLFIASNKFTDTFTYQQRILFDFTGK